MYLAHYQRVAWWHVTGSGTVTVRRVTPSFCAAVISDLEEATSAALSAISCLAALAGNGMPMGYEIQRILLAPGFPRSPASLHVCTDSCKSERSVARLTTSSAMSRPLGVSRTLGMSRKRGSRMIYRKASNPIFPLPMCS